MTIMDLARTAVITVPPDAGVNHVAQLMAEESVGSVVVVDGDQPTGLITDRDLALEVVGAGRDPTALTAADVMAADPFTVTEDAGLYEALQATRDAGVRRVPIVTDSGTLAGIVTLDDFVVLLAREFGDVADVVEAESPAY